MIRTYSIDEQLIAFSTERACRNAHEPYDGFNITWYTDDKPEHIAACKAELCSQLNIGEEALILPRQVHDTKVAEVTYANMCESFDGIDALVTHLPHICIGVSTADCVPLLFYDSRARAIAAAHAGWRGTVGRIGRKTAEMMQLLYDSRPEHLKVVIGPSIGPDAFEVGKEVYDTFAQAGFQMQDIAFKPTNKWHIDLWRANALDLVQIGVPQENIQIAGICTYDNYNRFFSARRLGIKSGRIYTGIMIK